MILLHLSDLHFRKDEVGSALDPNAHLRNEIVRDAERLCSQWGRPPDAIVISGDLAYAALDEEYEFALSWLNDFCTRTGSELSKVFVVPGNHDVLRNVAARKVVQSLHRDIRNSEIGTRQIIIAGLLKDADAGRLLYESLSNYNNFANRFFCDLLPPERTMARRDLILNDGSKLRLCGLNSVFASSESDDKIRKLHVDPAALQIQREYGVEYVAICHHPYSWLEEGDTLRDHLNDVARLHLFGHEHTNRIEVTRDWIRIQASAAHPDRTELGWEPGYNVIDLQVVGSGTDRWLESKIHVRVWQQRPGQFRPKMDGDYDFIQHSIKLDPWNQETHIMRASQASGIGAATRVTEETGSDTAVRPEVNNMDLLRDVSIRFFGLNLSQKSAIAGKLDLFEEDDVGQPDFERFRRVLIRARDRGQINELVREIEHYKDLRL